MHQVREITPIIHENFSLLMAYAFSRRPLEKLLDEQFIGEWKFLRKSLFTVPEKRADRALLEMAAQIRVFDDKEALSEGIERNAEPVGHFVQGDGNIADLSFRRMTNKVLHASKFDWDFSDPEDPKIICHPTESDRWQRAVIRLVPLAGLIGSLTF